MEEIWKPIAGWEDRYEVSNLGNIRNAQTLRLRSLSETYDGYLWIVLARRENGKKHGKWYFVHRLVAEAFVDNPNELNEVDHINGIRNDNRADNLQWITHKNNCAKGKAGGKGTPMPVAQYDLNGNLVAEYASMNAAARETGISFSAIYRCANGYKKKTNGYMWRFI